jgi:hypothetical protein
MISKGIAFVQAELADQGAEGFFHGVTYHLAIPSLSMKNVTAGDHEHSRGVAALATAVGFAILVQAPTLSAQARSAP